MNAPSAPIYLDYNGTTPVLPEVVEAMLPLLRDQFGNPSSSHVYGRRAATDFNGSVLGRPALQLIASAPIRPSPSVSRYRTPCHSPRNPSVSA